MRLALIAAAGLCGCGDNPRSPHDGSTDAAIDAPSDALVALTCQSPASWCVGTSCLAIPQAPPRGPRTATASGGNGSVYFATSETNTLATANSNPVGMTILPSGTELGFISGHVSAMAALSSTDIYACTPLGIAWRYDGSQWEKLPDGWVSNECDALWAASDNEFWAIGLNYLHHKVNDTWTSYSAIPVYALDGRGAANVWFGGSHGYLAHWTGTEYQVLIDMSGNSDVPDVRSIAMLGDDDIAFNDQRLIAGVLKTSIELGYPAPPELTWGSSANFWIVTKTNGVTPRQLWHYDGAWARLDVPTSVDLATISITGSGANDVWFVASHQTLHWDGENLTTCNDWGAPQPTGRLLGIGTDYNDLWLQEDTSLYHSSNQGAFVRADDGVAGTRGFDASTNGVYAVSGVDAIPPSDGTHPIVRRYDSGSWTDITCPWAIGDDSLLLAAKVVGANNVWLAGNAGHVFHWDGMTCTAVAHPLASTTFRHINATGPNDVWIFGDSATLHWDGMSMTRYAQTIGVIDSVAAGTDLWAINVNDVLQWDGATWTARGGGQISAGKRIWATSSMDVWAYTSTLLHFDGMTWTPIPVAPQLLVGAGTGAGLWGNGITGDFAMSVASGIVHHGP